MLRELLSPCDLDIDIIHSLNAAELARRQFREIARVAGLVTEGYPGEKSTRQIQASAGLLYDVFVQYDPDNLLLAQARTEVLERQLERSRIAVTLAWIAAGTITVTTPPAPDAVWLPRCWWSGCAPASARRRSRTGWRRWSWRLSATQTAELAGETVTLLPERALYWPRRAALLIADLHLGKDATFRASGVPLPGGTTAADLARLSVALERSGARRLVILGDFFHARRGRDPALLAEVAAWRAAHADLEIVLVAWQPRPVSR